MQVELSREELATIALALMCRKDSLTELADRDRRLAGNKAHWSQRYTQVSSVLERIEPLCE